MTSMQARAGEWVRLRHSELGYTWARLLGQQPLQLIEPSHLHGTAVWRVTPPKAFNVPKAQQAGLGDYEITAEHPTGVFSIALGYVEACPPPGPIIVVCEEGV